MQCKALVTEQEKEKEKTRPQKQKQSSYIRSEKKKKKGKTTNTSMVVTTRRSSSCWQATKACVLLTIATAIDCFEYFGQLIRFIVRFSQGHIVPTFPNTVNGSFDNMNRLVRSSFVRGPTDVLFLPQSELLASRLFCRGSPSRMIPFQLQHVVALCVFNERLSCCWLW